MVQVWAENDNRVTIDCGGKGMGSVSFQEDRNSGDDVPTVGSLTIRGVITKKCHARGDYRPNYREYYAGRPGYGPGARHASGQYCWPGATGCQMRPPADGMAPGL
mmetsp:Transcript_32921/g.104812  ORF Transcript_32921/g.104812 Transcript_32921/m.104812 type:complete len:105 (-) Transcript_32921:172-486(-)